MADSHYEADETIPGGRNLMDIMRGLQAYWNRFRNLRDAIIQEKDGGASGNAQFAKPALLIGYVGADTAAKQAAAAASFGEIDSAFGAGDAAISQMLARHLTGG